MHIKTIFKQQFLKGFLAVALLFCSLSLNAQNISLKCDNEPLKEVLDKISNLSKYKFIFSNQINANDLRVSISSKNEPVEKVFEQLFKTNGISYTIKGNQIVLTGRTTKAQSEEKTFNAKGIVKDAATGESIPGAAITLVNSKVYAISDLDGRFEIPAKIGDLLSVASLSMITKEVPVKNMQEMIIEMDLDNVQLQDVIVTGYQTISKERATGSFVKVNAEALAKKPVTNISSALTGLTPGMTVTTNADGTNRFLIRGQGSMQGIADRDPLIVVDGFAIQGFSGISTGVNSEKDPFASINPNDVESVTVLKDAAATSIYGARAANGVIVITTKKGALGKDKLNINVNAFVSISNKPNLDYTFNMASLDASIQYLQNMEQYSSSFGDTGRDPYYNATNPYIFLPKASELLFEYKRKENSTEQDYNNGIALLKSREGRWMEEYNKYIFRNAVTQQYNINMNGGSTKNRYNFSVVYDRNAGTSIGDTKNKVILNFSNTYQILKNLSVSVGVNAQISNNKNNGVSLSDLLKYTTPYTSLFNEDGSYAHIATKETVYEPILQTKFGNKLARSWNYNPLQDRGEITNESKIFNTRFQAGLDYKIIEGLNVSFKGQYERNQYKNKELHSKDSYLVRGYSNTFSKQNNSIGIYETFFPDGAIFTDKSDLYSSYNVRGQIDYNKTIAEKHDLTVLLGGEILSSTTEIDPQYTRYGYNPNTNSVQTNPDFITRVSNIWGKSVNYPYTPLGGVRTLEDRFISGYMNFAYTYDKKYTVSASARADASNFISDDVRNKFSPFWSVGAAWNISRENFMKDISWINHLKLRASYGLAGVAAGKNSVSTLTTLKVGAPNIIFTNNEPFATINIKGNPTLTWEKSKTADIALDFDLFNGKLYGSIDYYNRQSYDVLANATTPYIAQSQMTAIFNNAEISNKGIEITLGSSMKISDYISWRGDFNFSYNKNTVEEYNIVPTVPGGNYVPGRPLGCVYGYKLVGYTEEGYPKMEGKDGKIEIITSRATSHTDDVVKAAEGEDRDSNNWYRYLGTTVAPYNIGFTNSFRIYDFTVSFMLTGKFGHVFQRTDSPSADQRSPYFAKCIESAMQNNYTGAYSDMPIYNEKNMETFNTGAAYSYISRVHAESTVMFENANHIRLNEIYVGYDMPKRLLGGDHSFVKGLNIYAQARNLGIIWAANDKGIDPDYQWGSTNNTSFKPMAMWTFGVKLNF